MALPVQAAEARSCPKIVGGCAAAPGDWPFLAALRVATADERVASYVCGGTVIAPHWVLTAAHCVHDFIETLDRPLRDSKNASHRGRLQVVLGAGDLREVQASQVFGVERVVIHETYRAAIDEAMAIADPQQRRKALARIAIGVGHDIALLRLEKPASVEASPLSLAAESDPRAESVEARVAGFGTTEHTMDAPEMAPIMRRDGRGEVFAGSATLLQALLPTVPMAACKARYPNGVIGQGQVCAGLEQGGRDSCQGDSGGPLMAGGDDGTQRQIGIVSWGDGCAERKGYGVYTRVSHFGDWIQKHTGPLRGASRWVIEERLTPDQIGRALAQLESALGAAKGRVRIGLRGGNKVRLGDRIVFDAESTVGGRLLILDIDASGKVTLLYPNKFVAPDAGRIRAGDKVAVPGPNDPEFTAFEAQEPLGVGRLVAIVAPEGFDIERFAASVERRTKGFVPVNDPPNFLMQIIRQIEVYLGLDGRAAGNPGAAAEWGYAVTEYEITR